MPGRSHIAIILTVIYTLIIISPLAARVLSSKSITHVLTGECTGDCRSCGCSVEGRVTRSCCCVKKKQQQALARHGVQAGAADCCSKAPPRIPVVIVSCGSPCGGGKHVALSGGGFSELFPSYFMARFGVPCTGARFPLLSATLASCEGEPPDPPPKNS